jgi:hypothetical protein
MDPTIEIEGAAEALAFATTNAQTKPNVDCVSTQKVDAVTSCER